MGMNFSTATTGGIEGVTLGTLVINYSQTQLDLLGLSYDALRESVYNALREIYDYAIGLGGRLRCGTNKK